MVEVKNLFIWRHVDRKMLVFVAAAFLLMGLSPVDAAFKCVSGTGNNGDVESTTSTLTERIEASLDAFDSFDHLWVSHSLRKLRDRDHHCLHGWFQNSGLRESVSVEGSDEHLVIVVPDDYPTIQDAVDASSPGDTLTVRDGFYKENVVVDKPYLTIKSENGSENCIVKAADTHEAVFSIYAAHTNLNGFTVTGATYADGVYVFRSDFCSISNNNISDNNKSSRIGCGINLVYSSNNRVSNNIISKNVCGISLYSSNNNEIFFNNIISNHASSIDCWGSSNNNISNNTISNNGDGISFVDSSNNEIANNTISNNGWY
ncbi:MAG TPA: hypothetical protein ENI45_01610, partial [Thermoplasmatales archaeon]|nr:hypothetical protein [Thermoplasmatales archaeon]